jgi:salicylate hydroxylase
LIAANPGVILHRSSLLRELLAPIPQEALHVNKKLADIRLVDNGVEVTFDDGSRGQFDAVIGADGIFSTVRDFVLQDVAEGNTAAPAGFWGCRNLVPLDKAISVLGKEYFDLDRQYAWVGPGSMLMHDVLENRTMVQCVITSIETEPDRFSRDKRDFPLTKEFLANMLKDWDNSPVAMGIIEVSSPSLLTIDIALAWAYSYVAHLGSAKSPGLFAMGT